VKLSSISPGPLLHYSIIPIVSEANKLASVRPIDSMFLKGQKPTNGLSIHHVTERTLPMNIFCFDKSAFEIL
jgi:hypothetical protein